MAYLSGSAIGLSAAQHQFLIDHVDGARPITNHAQDDATMRALFRMKLICFYPSATARPTETRLTDDGRYALCVILGWMADCLTRAQQSESMVALLPKKFRSTYGFRTHA